MKVNFTMLCHARPRLLQQALDSIGDTSDMEFAIHADAPMPEVLSIARTFMRDKYGMLTSVSESKGTGAARNSVISAANLHRKDMLYLSDDDVKFLRPDWLSVLTSAYEEAWKDGYRVIGAYNHPYHLPNATTRVSDTHVVHDVYSLALQSMLMKWSVWDEFGPFCHTPVGKVCQSEDADFCNKIRDSGFKVGVIYPPLLVNCGVTNSFGQPIPGSDLVRSQALQGVIVE